jgi:hypothetical protein
LIAFPNRVFKSVGAIKFLWDSIFISPPQTMSHSGDRRQNHEHDVSLVLRVFETEVRGNLPCADYR